MQLRTVANGIHCDTTEKDSPRLPHVKGEIPLYHRSGDKPLDPITLVQLEEKHRVTLMLKNLSFDIEAGKAYRNFVILKGMQSLGMSKTDSVNVRFPLTSNKRKS